MIRNSFFTLLLSVVVSAECLNTFFCVVVSRKTCSSVVFLILSIQWRFYCSKFHLMQSWNGLMAGWMMKSCAIRIFVADFFSISHAMPWWISQRFRSRILETHFHLSNSAFLSKQTAQTSNSSQKYMFTTQKWITIEMSIKYIKAEKHSLTPPYTHHMHFNYSTVTQEGKCIDVIVRSEAKPST